jgi:hypothetical protein
MMLNVFDNLVFETLLAAVNLERFEMLKRFGEFHRGFGKDRRFILAGVMVILILLVLLELSRRRRIWREEDASAGYFDINAERVGLTADESKILRKIAKYAGLRRIDAVFTMKDAFVRGSEMLMKKRFMSGLALTGRKHLNEQVISIRGKLGFGMDVDASIDSCTSKGLSSRQIPVGRSIMLSRVGASESSVYSATIIANTDFELKLKASEVVASTNSQIWRVHYQLGARMWKFDSLELSSKGDELILRHCDEIRLINRRKFVHAPVDLQGYISVFPCAYTMSQEQSSILPRFIRAKIVEISGPGLLIEADTKLRSNTRLLVVFEIEDGRVIQNAAEVRWSEKIDKGYKIAVEMVNVREACINELVAATNSAAIKTAAKIAEQEVQQENLVAGTK